MYERKQKGGFGIWLAGCAFCFLLMAMLWKDGPEKQQENWEDGENSLWEAIEQEVALTLRDVMYEQFIPSVADGAGEGNVDWLVRAQTGSLIPLYGVSRDETSQYALIAQELTLPTASAEERMHTDDGQLGEPDLLEAGAKVQTDEEMLALLEAENEAAKEPLPFVPRTQRMEVDTEELKDYETLIKQFYTIDANTFAGTDQLNVEKLLGEDVSIEKRTDGPQILIYHTHSQETFADSVPGDEQTSIVGVGERLAQILQEEYGYQVLHHTGQYDVDSRDDAYGKSLPALKQILEENPTIEVVIDLHRDQMPEETKLVMDLDGRPTARFMFFNGLSRTKQSGDIDYLQNENIDMNLATSFQMQLKCEEYYPGLTRKIYLKGYRYNMHLCPRTMLVELGAQNNTVEEAMNACDPLAHVIDMVLSGD